MEKTISINLNNQNFQIEEEAYNKLANYLESIKRHCGAGADSSEVISDIENSLAEKLKLTLTPYKEVITNSDIDSLIKIMGTVEDFDREIGSNNPENSEKIAEEPDNKTKRKLYRDNDNAIIGGVAAGLGNYFDIDPVLFRIIFCALIFAGGSGIPIYIILYIVMPEAKTAYQKLEMQGQAPTLAAFKNLSKTSKTLQENSRKLWQKRSALGKIFSLPLIIINGIFLALKKTFDNLWPLIKLFFGIGLLIFSLISLGALGVCSVLLILYSSSPYSLSFIPVSELTKLMPYTWLVITGFLSLAIPIFLILFGGISIIRKKNIINLTLGSIIIGVWMVSGIFFCALGVRYFPELQNKINNYPPIQQTKQIIDMKGVTEIEASGHLINVVVSADTSTPAVLTGRVIDFENIEIKREGNRLTLTQKPNIIERDTCLDCNLYPVELTVATSSTLKIKTTNDASVYDETIIE